MIKYPNLLSPIRVRNFVIKNRMLSSNSLPHYLQGTEDFPADSVITHYANRAKSGAAIVTCMGADNYVRGKGLPYDITGSHYPDFDMRSGQAQNYLAQLADAIHFHNSLACMSLFVRPRAPYQIHTPDGVREIEWYQRHNELTEGELEEIARWYGQEALLIKQLGFDMVCVHSAYRFQLPALLLSPMTNHRTDKYGGSAENRMRFLLLVLREIREAVGNDFLIEIMVSAEDPDGLGTTLAETAEFLRRAEPYADIAQLRAPNIDPAHPTGFILEETPYIGYAAYMKSHGVRMLIETIGGYQKYSTCEEVIRRGDADLIGMARSWISNPDYGRLAYEGREEDMVPCLRCNKCHARGADDVFLAGCSVNPKLGIEHRLDVLTSPPGKPQRIAVIGGGPAGMKAAIDLADRGHAVTLFEAEDRLGGQMKHADLVDFKWPLKAFKDYMICQVEKRDIDVRCGVTATPEMIGTGGFDTVIAALGARPKHIELEGLDGIPHVDAVSAIFDPDSLGKHVAVIGGGEVGVECGMYLAKKGHVVHVLEMRVALAADAARIHYRSMFKEAWENTKDFHGITGAVCRRIENGSVVYEQDGSEKRIPADAVVISIGMDPLSDEALKFFLTADRFEMIGDCQKAGGIDHAMRSAFAVASNI